MSYPYFFNMLRFMRLSPIALPLCCISFLVYCLHIPYRAGFLCVFKCYLKDPDFGAVRTHEVLPPCPFFAASKKKKKHRKTPASDTVERPRCTRKGTGLPLLPAARGHPLLVPNSPCSGGQEESVLNGESTRRFHPWL